MTLQIKKLIEHIDQLVFWLKENPNTPIPSSQKDRLTAVVNRILSSEELTTEEWEELKPVILSSATRPGNPGANTAPKRLPSRLVGYKMGDKMQKLFQDAIERTKQTQAQKANTIPDEKVMVKCPNCKCNVLQKNLQKHKKKCLSVLQKSSKPSPKATSKNIDIKFDNHDPKSNYDGSYGFHQFRENGRFGSYPSFDNMGDESSP